MTYVVGENGMILKVYPSVDPGIHAKQIIHDLGADHPPSPTPAASPAASATEPSGDERGKGGQGGKGGEQAPQKAGKPQPDDGSDVE